MLFKQLYLLTQYVVATILLVVILAMTLRLIFNYSDPNPFGSVGRFAAWLKQTTDPLVRPVADWLGMGRFDKRLAPLITMLLACLVGYFFLQAVGAVTTTLDGVIQSLSSGSILAFVGFLLYGLLSFLALAIFIRILLSWFIVYGNASTRFLARVTDPILIPARRLIPPLGGMIDISPIIVLFLIDLFQRAVIGTLIATGR
jgi:YggT family protein